MDTAVQAQDEWLALRCQSGEPDAFEDLVHVMERPLLYYAAKLLGDEERAVDAMQDVWIRVFRGIGKLKDPASLRSWLYRITYLHRSHSPGYFPSACRGAAHLDTNSVRPSCQSCPPSP